MHKNAYIVVEGIPYLSVTDLGILPADYPILNVITIVFGHYPSSHLIFQLNDGS